MKDPLVMGGLGFFVYGFYYLFISRNKKVARSIFLIIVGSLLMKNIKMYVFVAALPAAAAWLFLTYRTKISNPTIRAVITPVFLTFGAAAAFIVVQQLGSLYAKFTLEGFLEEANKTQWWLEVSTKRDNGSGYTLGDIDPSPVGLLKVFPKAVNVSLFRPYLWEARKVIVLPSALESFFTLLLTFYTLFKVGILRSIRLIITTPEITFCIIFSIIFAFAVGFTSFNFGALARYKIPALPFYYVAMVLLLHIRNQEKKKKLIA